MEPQRPPLTLVPNDLATTTSSTGTIAPWPKAVPTPTIAELEPLAMAEFSREEMNAKLETVEAKLDGRVGRIEVLIDGMKDSLRDLKDGIKAEATARRSDRNVIVSTTIGAAIAVIAIVIGAVFSIASTNTGLVEAVIAAFESGKGSAKAAPIPPALSPPVSQSPPATKRAP